MTHTGSGDDARRRTSWTGNVWVRDYYPEWLDNLADDVTLEAPAMNGTAHGAEAVRAIVVEARKLYESSRTSTSPATTATTASLRTTLLRSKASRSASSSRSPATPQGRPSTSW